MTDQAGSQDLPRLSTTESTVFDRWVARSRFPRAVIIALIGSVLALLPIALGILSQIQVRDLLTGYRAQLIYALVVVYGLGMMGPLERMRTDVALALRPIIKINDQDFTSVVNSSCRVSPRGEAIALGIGILAGLAINSWFEPLETNPNLLEYYAYASRLGIYAFASWTLFLLMANTRMINAILRQPSQVNIFHLQPFAPVGRHTVWLSLTLVGAVTLSLISVSFANESLWLEYVMVYSILLVSVVVLFLLNTSAVNRVLSSAKKDRLASIERRLACVYEQFENLLTAGGDTHTVATEITALATVKQEVKQTRTWPYNTEMLRTAAISVVTPIAVGLSRLLPVLLASDSF